MKLYISGGAIVLLLVFYAPLVLLILWKIWRALPPKRVLRVSTIVAGLVVAAAIPLWDVAITSTQMANLCPQAGITIKRTVNVDGFYTNIGGSDHLRKGFGYVEVKSGNVVKIYTKTGSETQIQEINTEETPYVPKSRYEFSFGHSVPLPQYMNIAVARSAVLDRTTSEEFGYAVRYAAYPGWIDRHTVALVGRFAWMCPDDPDQMIRFLDHVIFPNN